MAAPGGYNPNNSLLPSAGGEIRAMSGGGGDPPSGFNPSASLLPAVDATIKSFSGGDPNAVASNINQVAVADAIIKDVPIALPNEVPPNPAPDAAPNTNPPVVSEPAVEPSVQIASQPQPILVTPIQVSVVPTVQTTNAPVNTPVTVEITPEQSAVAPSTDKQFQLWDELVTIRDGHRTRSPSDFTDSEKKALEQFTAEKEEPSIQHQILADVYEGRCTTDMNIQGATCESVAQIARALMLKLSKTLNPAKKTNRSKTANATANTKKNNTASKPHFIPAEPLSDETAQQITNAKQIFIRNPEKPDDYIVAPIVVSTVANQMPHFYPMGAASQADLEKLFLTKSFFIPHPTNPTEYIEIPVVPINSNTSEQPSEQPSEEPAEKPAEESAEKPAEESAEESSEESSEESAEESAEKPAEEDQYAEPYVKPPTDQELSDAYASLGLPETATLTEVKKAYRNLVIVAHPNKGGDPEKFKEIQGAYELLKRHLSKNGRPNAPADVPAADVSQPDVLENATSTSTNTKNIINYYNTQIKLEQEISSYDWFSKRSKEVQQTILDYQAKLETTHKQYFYKRNVMNERNIRNNVGENAVVLNVIYVRHMYSCANHTKKTEKTLMAHARIPDPSLHCIGVKQGELLGEDFRRENIPIDMIVTSQMMRAIQTGYLIRESYAELLNEDRKPKMRINEWGQKKPEITKIFIQIAPYINEINNASKYGKLFETPDNTPSKIANIKKNDLTHLKIVMMENELVTTPDFTRFEDEYLPKIKNKLITNPDNVKKVYTVVIVTHSNLMKKAIQKPYAETMLNPPTEYEKPENGQLLGIQYIWKDRNQKVKPDYKIISNVFDKTQLKFEGVPSIGAEPFIVPLERFSSYQNQLNDYEVTGTCTICEDTNSRTKQTTIKEVTLPKRGKVVVKPEEKQEEEISQDINPIYAKLALDHKSYIDYDAYLREHMTTIEENVRSLLVEYQTAIEQVKDLHTLTDAEKDAILEQIKTQYTDPVPETEIEQLEEISDEMFQPFDAMHTQLIKADPKQLAKQQIKQRDESFFSRKFGKKNAEIVRNIYHTYDQSAYDNYVKALTTYEDSSIQYMKGVCAHNMFVLIHNMLFQEQNQLVELEGKTPFAFTLFPYLPIKNVLTGEIKHLPRASHLPDSILAIIYSNESLRDLLPEEDAENAVEIIAENAMEDATEAEMEDAMKDVMKDAIDVDAVAISDSIEDAPIMLQNDISDSEPIEEVEVESEVEPVVEESEEIQPNTFNRSIKNKLKKQNNTSEPTIVLEDEPIVPVLEEPVIEEEPIVLPEDEVIVVQEEPAVVPEIEPSSDGAIVVADQIVSSSQPSSTSNHYTVLGLSKNATLNAIKKAYRKLVVVAHPNKGGDEEKFKEIQKAYEVLIDSEARKEYNKQLQLTSAEMVKEQNAKNRKLLTKLNNERNQLNDKVSPNANRKLFNNVLKKNIRNKSNRNALLRNIEKGKNLRPTPPKNIINNRNIKIASLKHNELLPVEENAGKVGGRRGKTVRRKAVNLRKTQKKRGSSIKRRDNK